MTIVVSQGVIRQGVWLPAIQDDDWSMMQQFMISLLTGSGAES